MDRPQAPEFSRPQLGIDPEVHNWSLSDFWRRWRFTDRLGTTPEGGTPASAETLADIGYPNGPTVPTNELDQADPED